MWVDATKLNCPNQIEEFYNRQLEYERARVDALARKLDSMKNGNSTDYMPISQPNLNIGPKRKRRKRAECPICGKAISRADVLKRHLMSVHGSQLRPARKFHRAKRFVCYLCGERFTYATTLRRHLARRHLKPKSLRCEKCSKVFKTTYNFKDHAYRCTFPQKETPSME